MKQFIEVDSPVLPSASGSSAILPGTFAGGEIEPGTFHLNRGGGTLLPPESSDWVDDSADGDDPLRADVAV